MAEKARKKTAAAKRTASPRKTTKTQTAVPPKEPAAEAPKAAVEVCPRCGTAKFGPEDRIRAEGDRTVRYTVLVCERGHTFARPITR